MQLQAGAVAVVNSPLLDVGRLFIMLSAKAVGLLVDVMVVEAPDAVLAALMEFVVLLTAITPDWLLPALLLPCTTPLCAESTGAPFMATPFCCTPADIPPCA